MHYCQAPRCFDAGRAETQAMKRRVTVITVNHPPVAPECSSPFAFLDRSIVGDSTKGKGNVFVRYDLLPIIWMFIIFVRSSLLGSDYPVLNWGGWPKLVHLSCGFRIVRE